VATDACQSATSCKTKTQKATIMGKADNPNQGTT